MAPEELQEAKKGSQVACSFHAQTLWASLCTYVCMYICTYTSLYKETYNIDCTPTYIHNACCWIHVRELNFKCPVAILSLQHARCRIVVTQIPVGPLAVLVYDVGPEKPREAGRG